MRCETENPPTILMLVINNAITDKTMIVGLSDEIWVNAPSTMMLLIALVTLINGVCNEAETFQITMYPMKQERTKTVKCAMNDGGATSPRPNNASPPMSMGNKLLFATLASFEGDFTGVEGSTSAAIA